MRADEERRTFHAGREQPRSPRTGASATAVDAPDAPFLGAPGSLVDCEMGIGVLCAFGVVTDPGRSS